MNDLSAADARFFERQRVVNEWGHNYKFWTGELWLCPQCEMTDEPFEDGFVCGTCASSDSTEWTPWP